MQARTRKEWDEFWLDQAETYSAQATCPRLHVGAVITKGNELVSAGFNGSPPAHAHCEDVGCLMYQNHCVRTIHAEGNAVIRARKKPGEPVGDTLYCTHEPCLDCLKLALGAGLRRIVFRHAYPSERRDVFFAAAGSQRPVEVEHYPATDYGLMLQFDRRDAVPVTPAFHEWRFPEPMEKMR